MKVKKKQKSFWDSYVFICNCTFLIWTCIQIYNKQFNQAICTQAIAYSAS